MSDERLREAYEQGLPRGDVRPALDDVAAERLRKLVEREGSDDDRLHTLDTQLASAEGRRELEIVWAAARAARPRRARGTTWATAAGVLLAVGITGTWLADRREAPALRAEASPITLVAPVGARDAANASRFVWRSLRDADRYTLVVVDTAGNEVFAAETRDTAITMPDSVHLLAGREYLWWVQATTRAGASVTAVTQRLVITAP
ncbi:MAG: hypothetical protein IPP90_04165 [Gemmatimonadaceae bacterium]|nr:hypothetical protein [Gemmatimonadaceae bacterium]